ncbi:hypothetical protein ACJ41O_003290 [Fusarium nematophilum]
MKTSTFAQLALAMASVATAAIPKCSIECFQGVITDHPPMDCKEANMYLCFCKMPSLQWYYVECAKSDCGTNSEEAISFGTNLCDELGFPIDTDSLEEPPKTQEHTLTDAFPSATTTKDAEEATTTAEETTEASAVETTAAASETATTEAEETTEAETETAEGTETAEETDAAETTAEETTAAPSGTVSSTDATTDAASTPAPTEVDNGASSGSVSGLVAAAGVAIAVFRLL